MNALPLTVALASALPLDSGTDYVRVSLSLIVCLSLGVVAVFLLRRFGRYRGAVVRDRQLEVLESVRLDARTSLHLIRCGKYRTLVACGPGAIALSRVSEGGVPSPQPSGAPDEA